MARRFNGAVSSASGLPLPATITHSHILRRQTLSKVCRVSMSAAAPRQGNCCRQNYRTNRRRTRRVSGARPAVESGRAP